MGASKSVAGLVARLRTMASALLRATFRFEHRRGQGVAARFAGPHNELEGLEVAFAGFKRTLDEGVALRLRGQGIVQHQAVAEHDQSLMCPNIKVTQPKLFVDMSHKAIDFIQAGVGHLEFESTSDVQGLKIVAPIE